MCLYRYRVWDCGCDERFLTKQCSYYGGKGHVLHKDRERRDVSAKGQCPWQCPIRRSKMREAPPDLLAPEPTYVAVGKLALGVLKNVTKDWILKDPDLLAQLEQGAKLAGFKLTKEGAEHTMPYTGAGHIESLNQ